MAAAHHAGRHQRHRPHAREAVASSRNLVIALFGPTDPANTGPYGQRQNVIQMDDLDCVPCMSDQCTNERRLACLHEITPAQVCARARRALAL